MLIYLQEWNNALKFTAIKTPPSPHCRTWPNGPRSAPGPVSVSPRGSAPVWRAARWPRAAAGRSCAPPAAWPNCRPGARQVPKTIGAQCRGWRRSQRTSSAGGGNGCWWWRHRCLRTWFLFKKLNKSLNHTNAVGKMGGRVEPAKSKSGIWKPQFPGKNRFLCQKPVFMLKTGFTP